MSSPAGFLEFFVLEASDYIEQIDALVSRAGSLGPDASSLQRAARALRGSATMAKLPAFAELAGAVERVGRALRDNALRWEPAVSSALIAAVDDLKMLVRAARDWSPAQTQRASARAAELARLAPEHAA
ncbi:MAG TPA: Hpt domain-containing protein, partial [Gemmatimonadaceae bacterium]|nr:Hpt domain-containing protein [Gemmatimonadaceae bacterium]